MAHCPRRLNIDPALGVSSLEERSSEYRVKIASAILGLSTLFLVGTANTDNMTQRSD